MLNQVFSGTSLLILQLLSVIIPHISSLLTNTKIPAWAGGYVTLVLVSADGFVGEWLHSGNDYDWKRGAVAALSSFVIASMSRLVVHRGTPPEDRLLDIGASRANKHGAKTP